jgi:hypothetical protein
MPEDCLISQTLAFGLTDSPAGLAAWIVEKFRAWSDCSGDVEIAFTRDRLLANISLYWFSAAIGSSFWPYYARMHGPWPIPEGQTNLARLIFFDCFSKRVHLRRPGRANPLDPSADQGSVDRQDHGRESGVSRHARAGPHARRAGALPRARAHAVAEGKCDRKVEMWW